MSSTAALSGSTLTITNLGAWPAHNVSISSSIAAGTGARGFRGGG